MKMLGVCWTCGLLFLATGCGRPGPPTPTGSAPRSAPVTDGQTAGLSRTEFSGHVGQTRANEDVAPAPPERANSPDTTMPPVEPSSQLSVAPSRLLEAGIRQITGRHLTLFTDLPAQRAVDELPHVFDLAVPQWCEFFSVDAEQVANWHMTAYLIDKQVRFRQLGVLHASLPPFLHGYQSGPEIWCYEQPSEYYRRHLLLHEGTHGFMNHQLGDAGPPWYMEGTAELLATHRWDGAQLTLESFPQSREDAPYWGRVKAIKEELEAGRGKTLRQIMNYGNRAHRRIEPYAWCWAASTFFRNHSLTQDAFAQLRLDVRQADAAFSQRFFNRLASEWPFLSYQWQMFAAQLDYGYDVQRELFGREPERPPGWQQANRQISADRGWQSTGLRLAAGVRYRIEADGRYSVAQQPRPWWCEPDGVTLRYYRGLPLGKLIAAVFDDDHAPEPGMSWLNPQPIGKSAEITSKEGGILFLRINDFPAELQDNRGSLSVTVRRPAVATGPN